MKNVIKITAVLFLLVQTISYSQTQNTETTNQKQDTVLKKQNEKTAIETEKFKDAIGKFLLVEGDFVLEIVQENDKMFIISPFSKDELIQKNEITLREPTRGVDLELIKGNKDALKFYQNGYETTIERVKTKTEN